MRRHAGLAIRSFAAAPRRPPGRLEFEGPRCEPIRRNQWREPASLCARNLTSQTDEQVGLVPAGGM
jgi:hypothetical protein